MNLDSFQKQDKGDIRGILGYKNEEKQTTERKKGKKHKRSFSFSLFQKDLVKNFLGSSEKIKVIVSSSFYVC